MSSPRKHTDNLEQVYGRIKEVLEQARTQAYRAVNFAMVQAYWNIGRIIVEEEQKGRPKAGYGEYLLKGALDPIVHCGVRQGV